MDPQRHARSLGDDFVPYLITCTGRESCCGCIRARRRAASLAIAAAFHDLASGRRHFRLPASGDGAGEGYLTPLRPPMGSRGTLVSEHQISCRTEVGRSRLSRSSEMPTDRCDRWC